LEATVAAVVASVAVTVVGPVVVVAAFVEQLISNRSASIRARLTED
jgi:hypothetical protein